MSGRWRGRSARGLRRRFVEVDSRSWAVVALAVAFVFARVLLATQSGFGFHQGWNEGHYALLASGFLDHPLVPRYGSTFGYSVPPLFPYLVAVCFAVLGESAWVARLPSALAAGGAIVATYALGWVVYRDRTVAALGAGLLALLPYVQLYGGRAQTDMLLTFLITAALAAIVAGYDGLGNGWLAAGGALFAAAVATKQPALLLPVVVLAWLVAASRTDRQTVRRTGVLVAASAIALVPLVGWLWLNYQVAPEPFVADWERELFARTPAFANLPLLAAVGVGLGLTPLVAGLAGFRLVSVARELRTVAALRAAGQPNVLVLWVIVYGAFVLARTPRGHQYYLLVLAPPVTLLATRGFASLRAAVDREAVVTALAVLVVANALVASVVIFELSGEFSAANAGGETVAPETAEWLAEEVPPEVTILVINEYRPPIQWYLRSMVPPDRVSSLLVVGFDRAALERVQSSSTGPVYLVYPAPNWGPDPLAGRQPIYRSPAYEFTVLGEVGDRVETRSKFRFYLEDRRLVVYRLA